MGAATVALVLTADDVPDRGIRAALSVWVVLPYVLAGAFAWRRRPESRFGPLMIVAGFVAFLSFLGWSSAPLLYTIGVGFDLLPPVIFLHVFLAFPSGRLEGRLERWVVGTAYVVAIVPTVIGMILDGYGSGNLIAAISEPRAAEVILRCQLAVNGTLALVGVGLLVARRLRDGPPLRRSLALLVDSFALALVAIAGLQWTGALGGPELGTVRRLTFLLVGAASIAFLIGLVRARLARVAVGDLLVELREQPGPAALRDALARALRDPTLELAYWLPEFRSYAALDGSAVQLPDEGGDRAVTVIERSGAPIAALVHDPSLADEPELLDAVTAAAGIALENARLHAELRARLEELQGSRARIAETARNERKRLERNLHDGAQQRLIALSLELSLLEDRLTGDAEATAAIAAARREIAASLGELREVARGLHPAVVSDHGLDVALEQLAARAAVPVDVRVSVRSRLPEALEVAAYYLVSESLANVAKYARASRASVEVARRGDQVVVEVVDDGAGGADERHGSGLRGLADRVESLGGTLRVWSPPGGGTRVRAEIPCAP